MYVMLIVLLKHPSFFKEMYINVYYYTIVH